MPDIQLSGIKSLTLKDKNIFFSLNFSVVKDNNNKINKLAFLGSPEHSQDEWGGYYYILEAREENIQNFKRKYKLSPSDVTKTATGNYRVTCVLVG